jgi:Fe2+ or Zn2+ uptake regulation protein
MSGTSVHDRVGELLSKIDQRYTGGRRTLVGALLDATQPVTVEQVVAAAPDLRKSSVYRNLSVLEEAGAVSRILSSDEFTRYELAEDLTDHHHHHLICSGCGDVKDFTLPADLELSVEKELAAASAKQGFVGDHHRLDLIGRCERCRE